MNECQNCAHWVRLKSLTKQHSKSGRCRRFPPMPTSMGKHDVPHSVWAKTNEDDVCGEHTQAQGT